MLISMLLVQDQEQLWRETTQDVLTSVLHSGHVATYINPALYHDIQVILSRLVAKASQLIDNVTKNLAESWMHIRMKFDGGKVVNRSQSGSWEGLGHSKILARIGAPVLGRK